MNKETLQQRIALWKVLPLNSQDMTDTFVDALISRIEELENEIEDLDSQLLESREYD
jgi:Mg2+ and Co2+ transporter CorA